MIAWKLHYFKIYGRGEAIRIIFTLNNTKFEDIRYSPEEWKEFAKQTHGGEFGQLPVLEKINLETGETQRYSQSWSIMRYLC